MSILGHSILAMALSTAWFVGFHFLLSHPLREAAVARLGSGGFRALYSIVVAIGLAWMIHAHATAPYVEVWGDTRWARHLLMPIMLVAVFLLVLGTATPSPGLAGAERARMDYAGGLGIHAITRHPGLWGFALWALGHMIANGDAATIILTSGIAILAFGGMRGIDARKRVSHPEAYGPFIAHTSIVPFVALFERRVMIDWRKIGLWRPLVALGVYVLLLYAHPIVIGRSAMPI